MDGSNWVALAAVIVTGVSIYFNYRGSGKRLKHEAKLLTERLADEKRRDGLPLAAKAYRLASDVRRMYELSLVEKRAGEVDAFGMGSDAKQAVREAVNALELVTVAGSDIMIQAAANLTLMGIVLDQNPQAVIIDNKEKKTYFLNKGQFIREIKIEDILKGKVILSYEGEKLDLRL